MATRVQGTGTKHGTSGGTIALLFASPPTVGNSIIVLLSTYRSSPNFAAWTASDNYGNAYTNTGGFTNSGNIGAIVFVCPAVGATGASFTVTVTPATSGVYWAGSAVEIAASPGLVVDQIKTATGSGTAPASGSTPALVGTDTVLAAVMGIGANPATLTVVSVSPTYLEEHEELDYNTYVGGEGNTRLLGPAVGTTPSVSWTSAGSGTWAAVLVALKLNLIANFTRTDTIAVTDGTRVGFEPPSVQPRDAVTVTEFVKAQCRLVLTGQTQPNWLRGTVYNGNLAYFPPTGTNFPVSDIVEVRAALPMDQAGRILNFGVRLESAPGGTATYTFTLRVNGVDSAVSVTLGPSDAYQIDSAHSFTVAAGDKVSLTTTGTNSPPSRVFALVWEFEPTNPATTHYAIISDLNNAFGGTATNWLTPFSAGGPSTGDGTGTGTVTDALLPIYGMVTSYRIVLETAPGVGKSRTFLFVKNGSAQDGTSGSPNTTLTISDTATVGTATIALPVSPGDKIRVRQTPTNTPASSRALGSHTFVPTTTGEITLAGSPRYGPTTTTHYFAPFGGGEPQTTEPFTPAPLSGITLRGLFILLDAALPSGASRVFTLRKNGVDTAQTVSIPALSNSAGPAYDNPVVFVEGDTISLKGSAVGGSQFTHIPKVALGVIIPPPPSHPVTPSPEVVSVTESRTALLVPTTMEVRVAEEVSTHEVWYPPPTFPPSAQTPQVCLPGGYQLIEAHDPPPYADYWDNQLMYEGPWPTGDFTVCFWTRMLHDWSLKSAGATPLNEIEVWASWRWTQATGAAEIAQLGLEVEDLDGLTIDGYTSHDWHHIAVLRVGGETYLSVDNRPYMVLTGATGMATPWFHEAISPAFLPSSAPYLKPPFTWTPRIAYYRMWDAILGQSELRREARTRQAVRTTNLWRDTPLEGTLTDVTGNGRHWVVGPGLSPPTPVCGAGPLPWVADPVRTTDAAAATLYGPGERHRVELLGVWDVVRIGARLRTVPSGEPVTIRETAAAAPGDPRTNKLRRLYTQADTNASYLPPTVKGPWTYNPNPAYGYKLAMRHQLVQSFYAPGMAMTIMGIQSLGGFAGSSTLCTRYVTDPLPAQVISGPFNLSQMVIDQQYTLADQHPRLFRIYMYVTVGSTDAVRGVLLDYAAPFTTGNAWPQDPRWWQLEGSATLQPVKLLTGDRVVIEFGFTSRITYPAGDPIYSGYIAYYMGAVNYMPDSVPTPPHTYPGVGGYMNGWVEFGHGIYTLTLSSVSRDDIDASDSVSRVLRRLPRVSDVIAVGDAVTRALVNARLIAVVRSDAITVADRALVPWGGRTAACSDTITVTDSLSAAAGSPGPPEPLPPLTVSEFETIDVEEDWLRDVLSDTLTVNVYEYMVVRETWQRAFYAVVWDGGGTPPPPVTTGLVDYWKVGI